VACRNEVTHIRAFLDSLAKQEMGEMWWEVMLADGQSTDGTGSCLRNIARTI